MLIIFEESYCSLSQLHSVIIYVTFSASVAQTVAVSVIGYPVQLKCTVLYPVQLKSTLHGAVLRATFSAAGPFALTPLWRET